jgi:hypothetical protein
MPMVRASMARQQRGSASAFEYWMNGFNAGSILRSSSSAAVTSRSVGGGLAGVNSGLISQSFATGPVAVSGYSATGGGGLVGSNSGTISQSYATGSTMFTFCRYSNTHCGGAALVVDNSGTITQSFATGPVIQPAYGPFGIARSNEGTIANDVYWNTSTTGATIGVKYGTPIPTANGLTTAQMSTPTSFVGYDFSPTGVWAMPVGATHPVLRWQLAQ